MHLDLTSFDRRDRFNIIATNQATTSEAQSAIVQRVPRAPPINLPEQVQFLRNREL